MRGGGCCRRRWMRLGRRFGVGRGGGRGLRGGGGGSCGEGTSRGAVIIEFVEVYGMLFEEYNWNDDELHV